MEEKKTYIAVLDYSTGSIQMLEEGGELDNAAVENLLREKGYKSSEVSYMSSRRPIPSSEASYMLSRGSIPTANRSEPEPRTNAPCDLPPKTHVRIVLADENAIGKLAEDQDVQIRIKNAVADTVIKRLLTKYADWINRRVEDAIYEHFTKDGFGFAKLKLPDKIVTMVEGQVVEGVMRVINDQLNKCVVDKLRETVDSKIAAIEKLNMDSYVKSRSYGSLVKQNNRLSDGLRTCADLVMEAKSGTSKLTKKELLEKLDWAVSYGLGK